MDTPRSNRLHIAIFGRVNSGKSSLINAITNQNISLVSDIAGTTTDPVYKSMEIHKIGACVFIDTAGFEDEGELGNIRMERTEKAIASTDVAIVILDGVNLDTEKRWIKKLGNTPFITVINKADIKKHIDETLSIAKKEGFSPIIISSKNRSGIDELIQAILRKIPENYETPSLTSHLVKEGDTVLLVMPQDIQAPKGRLILPQMQIIRDLLDNKCIVTSVTTDKLDDALINMSKPPKLIITDSQVFSVVYEKKPAESKLTSFSVLMARSKGDIEELIKGAETIGLLKENSKVLIAEACTHVPLDEDIGRVKIPRLLKQKYGKSLQIDIVSGVNFPEELNNYDLIIHCGACMFNRKYMMNRINKAKEAGIPIANYGTALAFLTGILDKINY